MFNNKLIILSWKISNTDIYIAQVEYEKMEFK